MSTTAPKLLVRETEKTDMWVEDHIQYYHSVGYDQQFWKNDMICWGYYHNRIKSSDTNYLTKIGDSELPAKVRRIPKQRPFLDRLSSQQQRRPFVFSCVLSDKSSIQEKYLDQIKDYISAIEDQAQYVHFETSFQIQQIQDKIQQMQQMVQQQPQNQEEAQKIAEMKQALPAVINKFQYATTMLEKQDALTTDQVKKMQNYHKYDKKDWKEIIAQNTLLKLRNELDVNTESTLSFISGMVTGREAYYVDYIEGDRFPVFQSLNVDTVTYPFISSVKWIQDCPWVKITNYASYNDIIISYGKQIEDKYGKEKLEGLQKAYSENAAHMTYGNNGEAYFSDNMYLYAGSDDSGYGIKTERIWFKVPRNIKVKYTPNPFEDGVYFRHFIQNKEIIDIKDYKYSNGFYINKGNPKDIKAEADVEVMSSKKGEKYTDKYTNDLYAGVMINDEFIVCEGKCPLVLRDIDRHGKINLPVFGKTYSSIIDQPYSLISATKDLQDLYDIVHYHQELMLALSGTKTILFDAVFKPGAMSTEEWEKEKKLGTVHINSVNEDGKRSAFNQWQMFDLSVSNSIGTLDQIKDNIEKTMGDVMGVPPPMKGQMVEESQVGTFNASIKQAGLITEIRFAEHDLIESKALTHCLNLALQYCFKDGDTFGINNNDLSGEIVNIPEGAFNKVRFSCLVANNTDEGQGIEDMKQLIMTDYKMGRMNLSEVSDVWGIKTLAELKMKAKTFSDKAQEIAQMSAKNAQEADMKKEQLKIQLNNELLAPWKEQELKMKEMELQIKEKLGTLQQQVLSEKNALLQSQVEAHTAVQSQKIANQKQEKDVQIATHDKHLSNNEHIKMLQIQVDSLLENAKMEHEDILSRRKHHIDLGKNAIASEKMGTNNFKQ